MNDISGFGLRINLVASTTFPQGIVITQFADDTDPADMASIQVREAAMGINGDMVSWSRANPLPLVIAVIPGSDDDRNLSVLLEANRVGKGKQGSRDIITATVIYPDGTANIYTEGVITDGVAGKGVASGGRIKTTTYSFRFEGRAMVGLG